MKKLIGFIVISVLFLFQISAAAQEVPQHLKSIFPTKGGKAADRLTVQNLTVSQKKFLMEGTTKDSEGYLKVDVPEAYINQLRNLNMSTGFDVVPSRKRATFEGLSLVGEKAEGPRRIAYFFGTGATAEASVTVWRYKDDGGAMVMFDEYTNQKVDGMDGTLSLALNKNSKNCLWKLSANDENTLYEVVVTDFCEKGKPQLKVKTVLNRMMQLISYSKNA